MSEILIVGAGPTGLAAGLFLAQAGIKARIVEREREKAPLSKALGINPRTLDLLEETGATRTLLERAGRVHAMNVWRNERRAVHVVLARGVKHPRPFMAVYPQAKTERVLEEALAARGVTVERGVVAQEVRGAGDGNEGATVVLERDGGGREEASARWVLAADGSHSALRQSLGLGFDGTTIGEPWRLADVELETDLPFDEGHVFLLRRGFVFMLPLEGRVWRVISNFDQMMEMLPRGTRAGTVVWESQFRISHRMATRMRVGAVCLAGDAAHIHSPLGGRGMNLGIEDAFVWSRLVERGQLERYEALRRPVVESVVRRVAKFTEFPRGRTPGARVVRALLPLMGLAVRFDAVGLRRWVMGLDHEVGV